MSKIVYVCFRNADLRISLKKDIEQISQRITPDNFTPAVPKIVELPGITYGIVNPLDLVIEKNGTVLLGCIYGEDECWWEPKKKFPDGSYALFRSDTDTIEIVSDVVGSRTIWYFKNEDLFIAATSQRAIISLIGDFEFNPKVIPWLLSSGSLGPSNCWDSRLQMVQPDSSIIINRSTWEITKTANNVPFCVKSGSDESHESDLKKSLTQTFKSLKLDFAKWGLLLSGGYDSRTILCFLNLVNTNLSKLRAITWGLNKSQNKVGNDAFVARKLANYFRLPHKYYSTDLSEESIEKVFERFLVCGEGRIDHIAGYLDGFKIWKSLYEDNVQGIIRGDVCFNELHVYSTESTYKLIGMALCSDYANLMDYEKYNLPKQEIPGHLQRRPDESLTTFRDRFYLEGRIPTVLAALNDLKLPYVELINPLLSRRVINTIKGLPEHLRTKKVMFKNILHAITPNIEFATEGATAEKRNVLKHDSVVNFLCKELGTEQAKAIVPELFLAYILDNVKVAAEKQVEKKRNNLKGIVYKYLPIFLIKKTRRMNVLKPTADFNLLAFRLYIVCKMNKIFSEDADFRTLKGQRFQGERELQ
ncbi:MAG: hypothetical protein JWN56_534 [Sphingobacteriales bacterium]|nr:hypothetical protein [Sphingobacteriales bacterium]